MFGICLTEIKYQHAIYIDILISSLILVYQHTIFGTALPGRPAMRHKRMTGMRDF